MFCHCLLVLFPIANFVIEYCLVSYVKYKTDGFHESFPSGGASRFQQFRLTNLTCYIHIINISIGNFCDSCIRRSIVICILTTHPIRLLMSIRILAGIRILVGI